MDKEPLPGATINTVTAEDLESAGFDRNLAELVVEHRPYRRPADLLRADDLVETASPHELTKLIATRPEAPAPDFPLPVTEETCVTDKSGTMYGVATEIDGSQRIFLRAADGTELLSAGILDGDRLDYASIRILSWPAWALLSLDAETQNKLQSVLHDGRAAAARTIWERDPAENLDSTTARLVVLLPQVLSVFLDLSQTVAHAHAPDEDCDTNGCTGVPDFNFEECCNEHDRCYCQGGTEADRLACDEALYDCIKAHGHPILAWVYYAGVRALGASHFNFHTGEGEEVATPTTEPGAAEGDCHVTVRLLRVQYDGNDVGNDWSFKVAVDGEDESFDDLTVDHQTSYTSGNVVFSDEKGDCGEWVSLDLYAEATEDDFWSDDVGSNSIQSRYDCPEPGEDNRTYEEELEVEVTETYYGTARMKFIFEIEASCGV